MTSLRTSPFGTIEQTQLQHLRLGDHVLRIIDDRPVLIGTVVSLDSVRRTDGTPGDCVGGHFNNGAEIPRSPICLWRICK